MRKLGFLMHDRDFDVAKSRFFHCRLQFHLAETQPFIGVELTRFFEAMLRQIENRNPSPRLQNPPGLGNGALRMQCVVKGLRKED